jgi:hypothetical protein
MTSNSCIWRATTLGAEGSNSSDIIQFNGGTLPDATGHVKSSDVELETGVAENDKPFSPINELQDTKATRITVNVIGVIDNPSSSGVPSRFKIWELEDKVNAVFTKGRFGLRLDDFPAFNLTPTTLAGGTPRGYILSNIKLARDIEFNRLTFSCTLRFGGDIGTTPYSW